MAPAFAITDNLDWSVSHRPLFFQRTNGSTAEWPDRVAVVRDDNEFCLGSVSSNYETVQNKDLLKLISPLVDEGVLEIQNMGYLNNGARVFAQARVNEEFQVIGENYKAYITLLNGHVGNASVAIGPTATRVICGNTFAMAYSDLSEKYRHQAGVNERVLESTAVINYVNGAMRKYAEYVDKLATTRCTETQFKNAVSEIYQKDTSKMRDSFVSQLNSLFYSGRGNEGKTFYDAFNAVTEYASNYSRKSVAGRFNYSNFGQGARINQRAMRVLTEMAAV
jgi:phage/plasmid-like protein (TIGR03299 family)